MKIEIEKITVLTGSRTGPDKIVLHFNLPEATYPYDDNKATAIIQAASGCGESYTQHHFPFVPYATVNMDGIA